MSTLFTSELKEGMITTVDTYSGNGQLILARDTVITKSIITKLINNDVLFVEVSDKITDSAFNNFTEISDNEDISDNTEVLDTPQFKKFKRRYENNLDDFTENLNDIVHKNAHVNIDEMLKGPANIIKASDSPLGVMSMMSSMKNYDDSTYNHSLNVALICNILSTWLGFSNDQIELITACGLLHDVGKLMIPDSIIKKPGKLTEKEYETVKTHSRKGYELLKKKNVDIHIQYSALMHHEKRDGSGYPLGLAGDQIDWCAQIVTIADIYDAMTSKRAYRGALNPFTVINTFEKDGLSKYNPKYLMTFFENVVNSYMNCKVVLSNGVEGDIVYINKINLSKPMVKAKDKFIDLSREKDITIDKFI